MPRGYIRPARDQPFQAGGKIVREDFMGKLLNIGVVAVLAGLFTVSAPVENA